MLIFVMISLSTLNLISESPITEKGNCNSDNMNKILMITLQTSDIAV